MNVVELQRKLMTAARATPPTDTVPYAFEKRVMAQVRALPGLDEWAWWGRALWRAATPCLVVMILLSAWSLYEPSPAPLVNSDLVQDLDSTVLAAADQEQSFDSTW